MFPCSVTAIAGIFSFTAWSSSSSIRHAPSSSEYSVCRWRWTNSAMRHVNAETAERSPRLSLPFDGRRRLRGNIVHDAVDAFDLVDDARRDPCKQIVREAGPVGRHTVAALDRADRDRGLVGALVAHHPDALHRQEDGEALPQPRVPAGALDLFRDNGVGLAEQLEARRRHFTEDANGEAWTGKRLPDNEFFVETERAPDLAHLVLEELAQRLDQGHPHPLRQAADVVMAL